MANIYLDETGQFTKTKDGDYFIIGTFTTGDPRRIEKRFRSWQREKFPRQLRDLPEIKFSNTGIDDDLRLKTLKEIARLDVRIRYGFVKRQNIPLEFRAKEKIRTGHLYTELVIKTLGMYLPIVEKEFRVFCDRRHLKGLKISEFQSLVTSSILSGMQNAKDSLIQVDMIDSTTNANIQIADWISGALGRYYSKGRLGKECFAILKNNFLSDGLEIFKDYWLKNKKTQSKD